MVRSKYTPEDLAFAYELHCNGHSWDGIAEHFMGTSEHIRKLVYRAVKHGIKKAP